MLLRALQTVSIDITTSRMSHSRRNSATSLSIASRKNNARSVSSTSTKTSFAGELRGTITGTVRARTSTFVVPTASSLAKTRRLPVLSDFPSQMRYKGKGKGKGKEKIKIKRTAKGNRCS